MTGSEDILHELSRAIAVRAAATRFRLAAICVAGAHHTTGTLWRDDLLVSSEQTLPKAREYQVIVSDGSTVPARLVGRDRGTNVALLRVQKSVIETPFTTASAGPGSIALALGADGVGGITVRMGVVNHVGPEWHSNAGGRIDQRIVLDMAIARTEEGGPVVDVDGGLLGISTLGPRGQALVIPAKTVDRVVPPLVSGGRVPRGWLGAALQPVAVPDALHAVVGHSRAYMVMSTVEEGPAARAGAVAGDLILSVDGVPVGSRGFFAMFGPESVGRTVQIRFIRAGALSSLQATVSARPAE